MNLSDVLANVTAGGIVSAVFIILALIEFTPIKVSPLQWIGRRLNKETLDKVKQIEKKLDDHVAQSLRTKILFFQDDILANKPKTKEQWKEAVVAITTYEKYCVDNEIENGLCKQANEFIIDEYQKKLKNRQI